jgi:non-ribosomal peptide synthetase-like protein
LGLIALAMKDLRTNKNTISDNIDLNSFNYKRIFCGIAQSLLLPIFITLNISDWLAPFFTYHYFTGDEGDSITKAISLSLLMFVFFRFLNFGIAIFGKRILTKPLKKGTYPLWGITYFNWWLATKFSELPDTYLITSTFWMRLYLRALGAKVGKDAIIESVTFSAPELICIGDRVSIGNFANFENARVERGKLLVGPVLLEDDATVESYCVVEENTCIKKAGLLLGLSCLRSNQTINEGEVWEGTPANRTKNINKIVKQSTNSSKFIKVIVSLTLGLSSILASLLFFLPTFPAFLLIDWVDTFLLDIFSGSYGPLFTFGYIFILALPASALFVSATMLLAGCIRKALPKVTPQKFYIDSFKFLHKKFLTQIIDSSIRELHGLYASVFISIWLRLLGAKIGTNSEISNAEGFIPGLLEIGNDCFVADGASLGEEELNSGWITQNKTIINDRSFIGNSAYVAGGSEVPSDILIGVQTRTPSNEILKSGQTWLGSPAVLLPFRESSPIFPDELTFRPSTERYLARAFIESLRILTPVAFAIASGYTIVKLLLPIILKYGLSFKFILALSLSGCFYALLSFLLVLIIKWVLIGKYKSKSVPMWSTFVWFSEAVTSMYESLAVPNLLNLLRGTPLLPFFLRSLGVKIGKDVFINTTDFTEFDCVKIGDRSSLNNWSGPQTHLFEDRIMKIGTVNIGNDVSVGPRTIILYDTKVEDRVVLGSLSLVSKGENLPNDTEWTGSPAGAILAK